MRQAKQIPDTALANAGALMISEDSKEQTQEENPYEVLNLKPGASLAEIRLAFRHLMLRVHSDKGGNGDASHLQRIHLAYSQLKNGPSRTRIHSENRQLLMPATPITIPKQLIPAQTHFNTHTFLFQEALDDIPAYNLIILDAFAFDIRELGDYAQDDIKKFYTNPHVKVGNREFSEAAKNILRAHAVLGPYAKRLDEIFGAEPRSIMPAVLDGLITMLMRIAIEGDLCANEALGQFSELVCKVMTKDQESRLLEYLIRVPLEYGGTENMSLSGALRGGSNNPLVIGCTHTLQIFCWQMVLDFRPHTSIPPKVCDLAIRRAYLLGGLPPDTRLIQEMTTLGIEPPVVLIPNRIAFQNFAAIWEGLIRHPDFLQGNNGFLNRVRAQLTQRQREREQEPRAARIIGALIGILIFVSQPNWNSLSDVPSNFMFSLFSAGALVRIGVDLYNITQNIPHYILSTHQFLQNKIITPMGNLLQVQRAQDPLEHLLNPMGLTALLLFVTLIINEGEDDPGMTILIVLANIFFNAVLGQNLNEPEVNQAHATNPDEHEDNDESQGPRL